LAFPSQPPNWVEGQQALINGVTYVYSLANSSWSPLTSANTLTYPTITATTSTITGTETVGNSVVTGNEAVQGNETVSGNQIVLGNLGVGTSFPSGKLEIDQNYNAGSPSLYLNQPVATWGTTSLFQSYRFIQTNSAATDGNFRAFHVGAGGVGIGYATPPAYGSSDALYVNGQVGIGTVSTIGTLTVSGNYGAVSGTFAGGVSAIRVTGSTSAFSEPRIDLGETTLSPTAYIASKNQGNGGGALIFGNRDTSSVTSTLTERVRIDASGNVGVGTISPGVKLDVNGTVRSTYQSITNGTTNQYVGMSLANLYNTDASDSVSFIDSQGRNNVTDSALFFGHRANYGSYISFYTQSNSGTNTDRRTQQMLIENNGTVYLYGGGGGTQISMRNGGDLTIYSADNSYGTTIWCDPPTTGMGNTGYTFTEYLNLNSQRCGYDRLWDNYPSISVRNDTTNGGQGEFRIHGINGISGGDFSVYLRVDGGGNGSDRRRKTDIEPIINALETISKLKPVTYVATNSSLEKQTEMSMANGKRLGFIAQDLIPVLPEVVKDSGVENIRENGWADQYAVDYASMVSLLTAGVQELKTIVLPDNTSKVGVEPLTYGLNDILKIKPIIYREMTSTGIIRNHEGNKLSGFADEDLENLMPGVELTNDAIIGALINAIKELKEEITQLKKQESRVIVISK
jgi:hypothetical protein